MKMLFLLGQVVCTPAVMDVMQQHNIDPVAYLVRHSTGDWGELDNEDKRANELAVKNGERVLSKYKLPTGEFIYCITEADRSSTCLLYTHEY